MPETVRFLKRFISIAVAALVLLISPGAGLYNALAQSVAAGRDIANVSAVPLGVGGFSGAALSGFSIDGLGGVRLAPVLPSSIGSVSFPAVSPAASLIPSAISLSGTPVQALGSAHLSASPGAPLRNPEAQSLAPLPAKTPAVGELRKLFSSAELALGSDLAQSVRLSPESAHGAGFSLQGKITGQENIAGTSAEPVLAAGIAGPSRFFAKPAGVDIARAVNSGYTGDPVPPLSVPPVSKDGPPFVEYLISLAPRLAASIALAAPALAVGFPLIQAASAPIAILGGTILAFSSLSNAVMPFMGRLTPAAFRLIPGVSMIALGTATMAAPFFAPLSLPALLAGGAMGSFVALNGWGLYKFAGNAAKNGSAPDTKEALSTFFGALGATVGAGLVIKAAVAGGAVSMLSVAAFPLGLALLAPAASWAWFGIRGMRIGAALSFKAAGAVFSSTRNDTLRGRRLEAFKDAALAQSPWNALWLGVRWAPVWIAQGIETALALAVSGWTAAWQSPAFFLWGAAERLAPQSNVTKLFAGLSLVMFDAVQGSKVSIYNPSVETRIPLANSKNPWISAIGALGMRAVQLGWAAYAVILAPVWYALSVLPMAMFAAMVLAFKGDVGAFFRPYGPEKFSIENLVLPDDPLPGQVPSEPGPAKVMAWPYKIIAAAVALMPFLYFGIPMLAGPATFAAVIFPLAALAVGLAPILPDAAGARLLPGLLLALTGGLMLAAGSPWTGLLALSGGLALTRYARELASSTPQDSNSLARLGAFPSAVALTAGVGAAILGMTGAASVVLGFGAFLASPLLLIHTPRFLSGGVAAALNGFGYSVRNIHRVLNFWQTDTGYSRNLDGYYDYWIKRSPMNGSWLWVSYVPLQLKKSAEWLAAAAAAFAMYDGTKVLGWLHVDFNAIALPYLYLIPGGGVLASLLGMLLGASIPFVPLTIGGFVVGVLWLRAASLFAWGASHALVPDSFIGRFIAGFARSLLEQGEGSKGLFDWNAASFKELMDRKSPVSGRPAFMASVGFAMARLVQGVLWAPLLAIKLPYNLLKAIVDGLGNATRAPGSGNSAGGDGPGPFLSR